MSIWVVIPVKPLRLAKSRLSEMLSPEERQRFAEAMFRHVLQVVRDVPQVTGTLVISRDNHALALAREFGAKTIQESGAPELNTALMRATSVIASWRSDAVLVLPADLPLISPEDIANIINRGQEYPSIVIATDRNKDGTNALFIRPPGLIEYSYGSGSYRRHAVQARDAGAVVNTYESDGLLQDIDIPEDVENYYRILRRNGHRITAALEETRSILENAGILHKEAE
jgi:2-phospho-L-lactate guanylyltransferase